jgi:murein DD-endopeptidase MepM/ murein hydrolase activator NlpD
VPLLSALPGLILPLLLTLPLLGGVAQPVGSRDLFGATPPLGWSWPLTPRPHVARVFDPPERPWLSGHRGVDLRAIPGQEVLAPTSGTLVFAGWVVDRPVLTIDHGNGLRSSFEPVESDLPRGTAITAGQPIGHLAATPRHCPEGCLHWGVRRGDGDDYVNPLRFVADTRPSILLPWHDP